MNFLAVSMIEAAGQQILSGASAGRATFVSIVDKIRCEPEGPTPLMLSFEGIEVATASYLREAVFALKGYMRSSGSKYYPVVANANPSVLEELAVIADARKEPILSVRVEGSGTVADQKVIGVLDPKQATTFDRVTKLRRTTAGEMKEMFGAEEDAVAPTVWNNRLAALAAQGLILERARGRAKFYEPLFPEVL